MFQASRPPALPGGSHESETGLFQTRLRRVAKGLLLVLVVSWVSAGARSSPADLDQGDIERLKQRVHGYLSAVRSRQLAKAREFILPRSRNETGAPRPGKSRMTGFSIFEVEPEAGHRSAIVTVKQEIMAPPMAGRIEIKKKLRWKREAGEWFLDPADPPRTKAELFREYYYDKLAARANPKPGETPPRLEVEFEETVFDFGLAVQGDPVQPTFAFRNLAPQDIVVEKIHAPEWLIQDRTEKRLIPAGAAGEIRLELSTAKLHRKFHHDVFVQFEPIKEMIKLRIQGLVYTAEEIAGSPSLSKQVPSAKSDTPQTP